MTDETRAELRRGIELILRSVSAGYGVKSGRPAYMLSGGYAHNLYTDRIPNGIECHNFPPLTTAQHLALSVLLGDESVLPQALADYLLDHGHEYATAVRDAERQRCLRVILEAADAACPNELLEDWCEAVFDPKYAYDEIANPITLAPDSSPPSPPARRST